MNCLLCAGLLATASVTAWGQAAPTAPKPGAATVTLNFVNADIEGVSRAMAVMLKQNVVVDPRVKGQITLISEKPLTPQEAYVNFLAALRGLGYTVVQVGGLHKVVPEGEAKLLAGTVNIGDTPRRGDQILTQVYRLNHENANNLVTVLRPLISPNNTINANPGNNTLVITDYADNLQRIAKIIAAVDVPANAGVAVLPLQHAVASDIAVMVQKMSESTVSNVAGAPPAGGPAQVLADPRSNSLIVRAATPAQLVAMRQLVQQLDQPVAGGVAGQIWVVYLKNADAVRLAAVLRAAFASTLGNAPGNTGAQAGANQSTSSTANALGMGSQGGQAGMGASPQATTPVRQVPAPSTGGFIQADPATNSLVITAPEPLYRQLRSVIDQLDARRAQVYIESMIVKVDASKVAEFGVQWQGISGASGDRTIYGAGTNFSTGNNNILTLTGAAIQGAEGAAAVAASPPGGLNIGFLKKIGSVYTLGALARFLETNASGNVLSTPNLVSLDNEEAKIVIGQNVPFVTGSFTNTGGTGGATNPFQTIERKDVGLTLRVKPQIGEGGTVRMTIYQENSSVVPGTASTVGPVTDKSAIETTVVVDDGDIMVLGGLLKDEYTGGVNKVPLLGDLPLVGNLFRYDNRSRSKSNLMVFLRPVVMRSAQDANQLSLDRYDAIRAQQQQAQPQATPILPIGDAPVLPENAVRPPSPAQADRAGAATPGR